MSRLSNPVPQFFTDNGVPIPGGQVSFFAPGTTTPQDTFSDALLTVVNPNPVILDSEGRLPSVFLSDTYDVVFKDADGVTIWTRDDVGDITEGQFELWNNDITYSIPDLVLGSDDCFYRSLTDSNSGNNPTTSAVNWEKLSLGRIWNTNVTYASGDSVYASDGFLYISLVSSNSANDPTSDDGTSWKKQGDNTWFTAVTYAAGNDVTGSNGNHYKSIISSNTGNDPTTSPEEWEASVLPVPSSINGLVPSNAADADHDITISAGSAVDSTDASTLTLSTAITKQLDAAWVVGTDMGGLFTGTIAADTTYHLFIIRQDSDGLIDAGFDTSLTAANIPSGYTSFRRVASLITDSSSNFVGFNATETNGGGIRVDLDARVQEVSVTAPGTSAVLVTMTVPIDIEVLISMSVRLRDAALANIIVTSTSQTDVAASETAADVTTNTSAAVSATNMERLTDTSGQIRYRSSLGSGLTYFRIDLLGWEDYRR